MAKKKKSSNSRTKKLDLRAIYDRYKREFSAADLQQYTEPLVGVPFRQVIAELEELQELLKKLHDKQDKVAKRAPARVPGAESSKPQAVRRAPRDS